MTAPLAPTHLTRAGAAALEHARLLFGALAELEKRAPGDVEIVVAAVVAHLRSFKPQSLQQIDSGILRIEESDEERQ